MDGIQWKMPTTGKALGLSLNSEKKKTGTKMQTHISVY